MTNRGVSLLSLSCLFLLMLQLTACGGAAFTSTGTPGGGGGVFAPSVTTTSLPAGTTGAAYSANLLATGGKQPYSWSLKSGSLPAGLSLTKAGAISGAPTGQGTFSSL